MLEVDCSLPEWPADSPPASAPGPAGSSRLSEHSAPPGSAGRHSPQPSFSASYSGGGVIEGRVAGVGHRTFRRSSCSVRSLRSPCRFFPEPRSEQRARSYDVRHRRVLPGEEKKEGRNRKPTGVTGDERKSALTMQRSVNEGTRRCAVVEPRGWTEQTEVAG